jgi:hypothetical protein
MADKDSSVRAYLLRPLRTFEQVLGGRSGVTPPSPKRVERCLALNSRDALGEVADEERVPLRLDPTD